MTGTPVEADITGVVVATTIVADTGFVALVRRDNGTSREVAFYGRNPNRILNGTENTVEDAWVGDLPSLGGTYAITGAELEGPDGPIGMSICADSSVVVLAEPPTSTHETIATESPARNSGQSSGTSVAVILGVLTGIVALVVLVRLKAARSVR